jgi:N4-gp56 family major capsid protein
MAYGFTDETYEFHEDDIPEEINRQLGTRKSTLEEMIDFAALQAGTQVIYAGGGLTRASVSRECTLAGLRQVGRTMMANQAPFQTPTSKTSQNYGSAPVMAGWPTFMHTNVLSDMRNLEAQGWIPIERATSGRLHPLHRGNLEEYACIFSPHLQPVLGAGAATGSTGLQATGGYVDVYLTLVLAAGAWGKLNPQTANSMTPNIQMPNQIDKSDPLGQKGIAAMKFWACSVLLRDGYMERYEHGVKSLTGEF